MANLIKVTANAVTETDGYLEDIQLITNTVEVYTNTTSEMVITDVDVMKLFCTSLLIKYLRNADAIDRKVHLTL